MINRRDLIVGGACLAAAASAEAMRPHNKVALLGDRELDPLIPKAFGQWRMLEAEGIVAPNSEDSLAAKLYNQTVTRMYAGADDQPIMLLIAYGKTQNDALQLHRPEICYPAFGFDVTGNRATQFALAGGVSVPGRELVATGPGREERISYWTRLGEYLPIDNSEQRAVRLRNALAGIIPDGVLFRMSNTMTDDRAAFALNARFAADFMRAVPPVARPALITTSLAKQTEGAARG